MKTSRKQLLEYIQQHRVVTAEELSRVLHMTQANVRRHLDILVDQDQVEVIGRRPAEGKGRPARFFSPSEKTLGNNLELLCNILLQEARPASPPEPQGSFLERVAEKMLQQISLQNKADQGSTINLTQRLNRSIHDLNQFHYQARWEAYVESPRLILGHCPYPGVPIEHPELCQIDALLLEGLLQTGVELVARLVIDKRGATSCIFRVLNR
jgi:predicted ArsR family transcriptional regulator